MSVWFRNRTPNTVYIALIYITTSCAEGLGKSGWYRVEPGRTALIFRNIDATTMRAFYAEDEFGNVWAGTWYTEVPNSAFRWCLNSRCSPGVPCETIGFRTIRATQDDAIFSLSNQRSSQTVSIVVPRKLKRGNRTAIRRRNTVWLNPKRGRRGCSR